MLRFLPRATAPFPPQAAAALRPYEGVTARLLHARGIADAAQADAFLHPTPAMLHDPLLMHSMAEALQILAQAKADSLSVAVYGDYDVDGVCACSLMTLALGRYGMDAHPFVPLRSEGYGLNGEAVRKLAETHQVLVTVDLGITNHEEVRLAQSLGMRVIVTDHHGLALEPSPADAVLNPLLGDYPYRRLCGTGVAFKLAQALLGLEACKEYLDLAALATVADIVPLTGENRVLVALGLPEIQARRRLGLGELLRVSGDPQAVTADTLGFQLGPRLNAAGRLSDAGKGVRLMLTEDETEAARLAEELDGLNTERKTAEARLVREAELAARQHDFLQERALIVAGDGWHLGVIGLAAGRLCQQYACPVCVLSRSEGLLHGSLRSVPGVHIHHCLQACDDLLLRYGGHELAAGVTLSADNEAAFCERLQAEIAKADPACFVPAQPYDAEVRLDECTPALYDELSLLAPFGCENPAPLLCLRDVRPEERRAVGAEGAHLKLTLRQGDRVMGGIAFSMGKLAPTLPERVDAVFSLGKNTFRGVTALQAEVKALAPVAEAQRQAFAKPDGEKEQAALLNSLLGLLAIFAGEPATFPEMYQGMPTETRAALESALRRNDRGVLALAHTNEAAYHALGLWPFDLADCAPVDPRSFHTLLTAPAYSLPWGHWAEIWLLDGELLPGEAALLRERNPQATVHVLPVRPALCALAAALDPGDDGCRALYRALRHGALRNVREAAQVAGMTDAQARTALHAFAELQLIDYRESPFAYTLLPPVKCSLDNSPLLQALRGMRPRPPAAANDASPQR